jgi:mRNA-degrading endonuclease toxin of MazEF toxin-antitoxin module
VVVDPTAANGMVVRSSIRLDQIRTVDRQRLARQIERSRQDAGAFRHFWLDV